MDIKLLHDNIAVGMTQREIADKLCCSHTTVRYWLKKYGLKTILGPHGKKSRKIYQSVCRDCSPDLQDIGNFYMRADGRPFSFCKQHFNKRTGDNVTKRRRQRKLQMMEFLGGVCVRCGADGMADPRIMHFHHRDSNRKEFLLSFQPHLKSWEVLVGELLKCDLLCSPCHQITHRNIMAALT